MIHHWLHRPLKFPMAHSLTFQLLWLSHIYIHSKIYQIFLAASHPRSTLRTQKFSDLTFLVAIQCSVWYPIPCPRIHNFQCNIQEPCCAHSHISDLRQFKPPFKPCLPDMLFKFPFADSLSGLLYKLIMPIHFKNSFSISIKFLCLIHFKDSKFCQPTLMVTMQISNIFSWSTLRTQSASQL